MKQISRISHKTKILLLLMAVLLGGATPIVGQKVAFPLPVIPSTLTVPAERASYLVAHYWDNFPFADSLQYVNQAVETEQALVDYVDLFRLVPTEEAGLSLKKVIEQAGVTRNGLYFFYNTFEKYLYDMDSPIRNESLFIPVLEAMIASDRISTDDKIRPTMLLRSVSKNRVGSAAADFVYQLADKSSHRLSEVESPYTLLLFFDPSCDECHQVIELLAHADWLTERIGQKQVTVLAIYPGEEHSLWRQMQPQMPSDWVVGLDADGVIYGQELYDLQGFPSLYLLDAQKQVILKETSPEAIRQRLAE